ncbi:hypothetical protein BDZ91DRAFT_781371 [Kalaharituber pfeilii]|nr:hypothetical protein BDZ91DRAFT_781371 [Kalaharituber pfeilii]
MFVAWWQSEPLMYGRIHPTWRHSRSTAVSIHAAWQQEYIRAAWQHSRSMAAFTQHGSIHAAWQHSIATRIHPQQHSRSMAVCAQHDSIRSAWYHSTQYGAIYVALYIGVA